MLTALELAGFKSFAEKTRFDFPDGITVIVGPNGSGKSNVVDAIKWVLGAQSAKALRGKDMIDVIFKGSSSAGRKPCNSAEATLVFDNRERKLEVDTEEVNVTRRVYRSGEGEYLINGQACRLKDIKNLFRGTGVGVDAYSLIEQGKVDRMLQASPRDRRIIFEEAAGISRFNAKKAEANRRLERVEQNLTRLKDIVDEVHTRLNRLKSQATKAQRYREMNSRLSELRLRLGWTEYSQLNSKVENIEHRLQQLTSDTNLKQVELEEATSAARDAELNLHDVARKCQEVDARLQDAQQRIAVDQNKQSTLRERITENEQEQDRLVQKRATLSEKTSLLESELAALSTRLENAQTEFAAAQNRANESATRTQQARDNLNSILEQQEVLRQQQLENLTTISKHSTQRSEHERLLAALSKQLESLGEKLQNSKLAEQQAIAVVDKADARLAELQTHLEASQSRLAQAKEQLTGEQKKLSELNEQVALTTGRLAGASERLEILRELQRHLDGVDGGARHLFELASHSDTPSLKTIHGLVADIIAVDVDLAQLIDTALGSAANILITENDEIISDLRDGTLQVPGRLSLMRLDRVPTRRFGEKVQLDGVNGVVGRADRLVRCKNLYEPLVRYLLGTTWLVESLEVALELGHFRGAGLRFITRGGELIESDGLITLGASQSASGLVSRRSEMQVGEQEIAELEDQLRQLRIALKTQTTLVSAQAPEIDELEAKVAEHSQSLTRQQAIADEARRSQQEIRDQLTDTESQAEKARKEQAELQPELERLDNAFADLERQSKAIATKLDQFSLEVTAQEQQLQQSVATETEMRIELARFEQRVESERVTHEQSAISLRERQQALEEIETDIRRLADKRKDSELEILGLSDQLAHSFLDCEQEEKAQDALAREATELRAECQATAKHRDALQRTLDKISQQQETSSLELTRFIESRDGLAKRYEEDYQITLDVLREAELIEDESELAEMDAEAAQLRQDIVSVGEINMSALAELDELQERFDFLNGQYEDLVAAKESLQRIIQKINQDSRRLFTETLEVIRQNFQKLYRKSFGGGSADIVLEEGEDVLECGIDIIATPPGKTALSNSLLSGGEKALTAVALLLAIFQHRPSPFCVLDEVDAPFDEANIGRFVNVLNEFLDWTKFIIVTHSKKTMTASTTLYGVTMQESGVSKQVAVKFEDVNEKGEIISEQKRKAA
ncbi:MAG: chromosome segregation protein SMC [Aureliella sp.]